MKKADMDRKLLDLKAKQQAESETLCPRCGQNKLKSPLTHNALSRYADLYVCDECGLTEAGLAMMNNPLPLEQWAVFQDKSPRLDFKALSMQEAVVRILSSQMKELHGVLRSLANNVVLHHKHYLYYFEELLAGSPSLKTASQVAMPTVYLLLY